MDLSDKVFLNLFQEAAPQKSELEEIQQLEQRYENRRKIGEGGSKLIYECTDLVSTRRVAQAIPKDNSDTNFNAFLREARLQAILEHPNILPVYDIGLCEGTPYFTMKLIEGGTLHDLIKASDVSSSHYQNEVLDIFVKICSALAYAHAMNIIHLDLKPENIYVNAYDEVLLGDWGLARINQSMDKDDLVGINGDYGQFTRQGSLSGTPGYMAPEQCQKDCIKSPKTDIYSLGAILVACFCKEAPVSHGTLNQKLEKTICGQLDYQDEHIPEKLRAIIAKALSINPDQRYAQVQEIIDDINALKTGYLTSAEQVNLFKRLKSFYKRNSMIVKLFILSFILITSLTVIFIAQLRQREQLAIYEKNKADKALQKYFLAEQERLSLGRRLLPEFIREVKIVLSDKNKSQDSFRYLYENDRKSLELINKALEFDPENNELWFMKGKILILMNQLPLAREALSKAAVPYKYYSQIINDYSDEDLQDIKKITEMTLRINEVDTDFCNDFMFVKLYSDLTNAERLYFSRAMVKMKNPNISDLNFTFDPNRQALDMSHTKNLEIIYMLKPWPLKEINLSHTHLSYGFGNLAAMPLEKINVSHTRFNDDHLRALKYKSIQHLNIAYTEITSLAPLNNMPLKILDIRGLTSSTLNSLQELTGLEKVVVDKEQMPIVKKIFKAEIIKLGKQNLQ